MASVSVHIPVSKVLCDIFLLMCVGFPILFLFLWGSAFQRGFFCDDESIRHPYHNSTVPSYYLYIFGLGMNIVVMAATELFNQPKTNNNKQIYILGKAVPLWSYNAYCIIGVFAFGAACSQLSTDVMKYTVGRLRPHFYTVCMPDTDCNLPINKHRYITEFNCTNPMLITHKKMLKELRLSFPSGHSSFSMYTMAFFAIYLQKRMTWDGSKLLKHTLQYLAILAAIFTGMTRISDYKHHWSDVLAGLTFGAILAVITASFIGRSLKTDEYISSPKLAKSTYNTIS